MMLLLFLLLLALPVDASVLVVGGGDQDVVLNGKPTVVHTVDVLCSDTNFAGNFNVGVYSMNVSCIEPAWNFAYQQIYCIPKAMLRRIERSCVVGDLGQFEAARQIDQLKATVTVAAASRRLLQFDVVGATLGAVALYEAMHAQDMAQAALTAIDDVKAVAKTQGLMNIATRNIAININATLVVQEQELTYMQNAQNITNAGIASLIRSGNSTDQAIALLRNTTNQGFTQITDDLNTLKLYYQGAFAVSNAQTADALNRLNDQVITLNSLLTTDTQSLYEAIEGGNENVITLTSQLFNELRKTSLRRGLVSLFFDSVKLITTDYMPLIQDPGIAPLHNGALTGPDRRLKLETVDLRYVTAIPNGGTVYSVVSNQIRFYIDSDYQIDHQAPFVSISSIFKLFGPSQCKRPYVETGPNDDPTAAPCTAWAEVTRIECIGQINGQTPTQFDWATANPAVDQYSQTNEFLNSYCHTAPLAAVVTVLKSSTDVVNLLNTECGVTIHNQIQLRSYRASQLGYFSEVNSTVCSESWQLQLNAALGTPTVISPLVSVMMMLQNGFMLVLNDVLNLEQKKYGILPGGFAFEDLPFIYTAPTYSDTGVPQYQGGAHPHECLNAYWSAAHTKTVCAYAAQLLDPPNAVSKEIVVSIDGPACTDPSLATCYPVGDSAVTANLVMVGDFSPETSFTIMGDVSQASTIGLWDVPDSLMEYSSNPANDANKLSYYAFPPGTTDTWNLLTWQQANGFLYDARSAGASLAEYHFNAVMDFEGYPMCDIAGGVATSDLLTGNRTLAEHGCVAPFAFSTDLQAQPTTSVPPACVSLAGIARVLYQSYIAESNATTITASSTSPSLMRGSNSYSITFWYKLVNIGDGGAVTALSVFDGASDRFVFGVDSLGQPYLKRGAFDSRVIIASIDLRDGIWHQIGWRVSFSGGSLTAVLYIDGFGQGSITNAWSLGGFTQFEALVAGVSAQISQLTLYPSVDISSTDMYELYLCQQAWMNSRCDTPTVTIIAAMQNISSTDGVQCLTSTLLRSTAVFDADHTRLVPVNPMTASWSISFWFRSHIGQTLNVRGIHGSVVAAVSGTNLVITVNGLAIFTAPNVLDSDSHFFVVTYSLPTLTAAVWMDLVQVGSAQTNIAALSTGVYAMSATTVWMVKVYSTALIPAQVTSEMGCVVDSKLTNFVYLPPIGYCAMDTMSSGYCRHPLMCNGHCSSFSTIDLNTATFTTTLPVCDAGWAAPDCLTPCVRTDEATGECIQKLQTDSSGLVPNGKWCQLLKHFKVVPNEAQGFLTMIPRSWTMQAQLSVPSGLVTQNIETGGCPISSLTAFADSSFTINMINQGDGEINLKAILLPDIVFNPAPGVAAAPCTLPCCNILGGDVIIPAHTTRGYAVAPCGNVTVILQLAATVLIPAKNCSVITGLSVLQAFQQASTTNVDVAVELAISASQSETTKLLADTTAAIFLSVMNLLIISANQSTASDAFLQLLLAQKAQLATTTFNPTALNNFSNPFNLNDGVTELLASSQTSLESANSGLVAQQAIQDTLVGLNAQLQSLAGDRNIDLVNLNSAVINAQNAIYKLLNDSTSVSGGFDIVGVLNTIGQGAATVALDAAHAGETILDTGLNLLGMGGSGIAGFFSQIIKIAIYILVIYIVYKLLTSDFVKQQCKRKPKKPEEAESPAPLTKRIDVEAQTKTGARARPRQMYRKVKADESEDEY